MEEYGIEKANDRLDKFKDHLMQTVPITSDRDLLYFEKMAKCWGMACQMQSPAQIITALNSEYGHQKSQAYKILADTFKLFGDAYQVHKHGVRNTMIEAVHDALVIAKKDRDVENILKCIDRLWKLYEFDKIDSSLIPPPETRMPAGTRVYTTAPVQVNNLTVETNAGK